MIIKMKTVSADADGVKIPGKEYEVSADVGKALVDGGYAEIVSVEEEKEEAPEEVVEEEKGKKGKKGKK
jgi:hypothetical protein